MRTLAALFGETPTRSTHACKVQHLLPSFPSVSIYHMGSKNLKSEMEAELWFSNYPAKTGKVADLPEMHKSLEPHDLGYTTRFTVILFSHPTI
jgi:hypothetical protein